MIRQYVDLAEAMRHALELARRGAGAVEPNPQVGAVVVDDRLNLLGAGFHARFGGPHAEIGALEQAGDRAAGATLIVSLEPCCHHGKTPPCVDAVLRAGIRRVVVGIADPFPRVAGQGIARLRAAGLEVEVGLLADEVRQLNAPFLKLIETGRPWVHAKWAMTLDGKIAACTGESRWISNPASRAVVHRLRGQVDAIVVGIETALRDDPQLTARPPGPRIATRIVVDSQARLPPASQLVRTARATPLLVATTAAAPAGRVADLQSCGAEVVVLPCGGSQRVDVESLLQELGRRQMTNILVEGGGALLGSFFDAGSIDELHVFVAPKLLGGAQSRGPMGGTGRPAPPATPDLDDPAFEFHDGDVYIHGRVRRLPHAVVSSPAALTP